MVTYRDTIDYLRGLHPLGIRFGLDPIRSLLARLNNPQDHVPAVLIAGTNGKGSTAAMTASILSAAGFRTGLYTSPDLTDVRERIRVDGRLISREDMTACAEEVRSRIREEVSYFEFLTAVAFLYYRQRQADIAVLETGMGGRLDATNVVTPLVSVITNISLEHREYLGDTLENRTGKGRDRQKGGDLPLRGSSAAGHRDPGGDLWGKESETLPLGEGDPNKDPSGRDIFLPRRRKELQAASLSSRGKTPDCQRRTGAGGR